MGAADMLKVNDYTKSKQRILYYILYGISGLELLFAIIGLAAGGKNVGLFCFVFAVLDAIIGGFNIAVTFNMKKEFSNTKIWTIAFIFAIGFTAFAGIGAIFSLVVMFKDQTGIFFGALFFDILGVVLIILTMVFACRDSGSISSSTDYAESA